VPNVSIIDLTSSFCDVRRCDAVLDGIVVYRDDSHITAEYARRLAPALGKALDSVLAVASSATRRAAEGGYQPHS
jgi:hypothetical protein